MALGTHGRFEAKTAIVTAASRGIGLAIARRLVDEGANVVITARGEETLAEAVAQLGGAARALGIAGRADDADHQAEVVRRTLDTFGSVDLLVNNAGINPLYGAAIDADLGAARKTVDVNVLAALSWAQQAYRAWMHEHGGAIVNVASVAGRRPAPGIGIYGVTKATLIALTELLAVELAPDIRVNAVAPGVVKTAFARALYEKDEDAAAARYPLKRLGVPEDVAGIVAFLLSEEASWITGETVVVDGGLLLNGGV
jgi:3-oxoacyl-[acyl-carrier protein] reductase